MSKRSSCTGTILKETVCDVNFFESWSVEHDISLVSNALRTLIMVKTNPSPHSRRISNVVVGNCCARL
eukprot:SAG31_NODE_1622_length_7722_cov_4.332940_4_plen_68_part_00